MIYEAIWVVASTALLVFCLRKVYIRGYRAGATRVLNEWKKVIDMGDDE